MADPCSPLLVDSATNEIFYLKFFYCRTAGIKREPAVYPVDIRGDGVIKPAIGLRAGASLARAKSALTKVTSGQSVKELQALQRNADKFRRKLSSPALLSQYKIALGHPRWALAVRYRQVWTRTDSKLGAIISVASVGVYPGTRQVTSSASSKLTSKTSASATSETDQSSETTSNQQWSDKTRRQLSLDSNSEVQPAATLNSISGSSEGVKVGVGGDLGIKGTFDNKTGDVVERAQENLSDQTAKTALSLKQTSATSREQTLETTSELRISETLYNPNRGNTLNYLYREVLESYRIDTGFDGMDLALFVPLTPETEFSDKWLLQNECFLRPAVPCSTLQAGFDAIKTRMKLDGIMAQEKAAYEAAQAAQPASGALTRVETRFVDAAQTLSDVATTMRTASIANNRLGKWIWWELATIVAGNDLVRACDQYVPAFAALSPQQQVDPAAVRPVVEAFLQTTGSLDSVFGRVVAAATSLASFSFVVGCGIVPPLGIGMAVLITGLAIMLDNLGIDVLPDDGGLENAVRDLKAKLDAYTSEPGVAPAAVPGAAPAGGAAAAETPVEVAARLRRQAWLDDIAAQRIDADIEAERLRRHIMDFAYRYNQILWSRWDSGRIADLLSGINLDPDLFEWRFCAFERDSGALRVLDADRLEALGVKWKDLLAAVTKQVKDKPASRSIDLSVPGQWAEPRIGSCNALDPFVAQHRDIDLDNARAALAAAQARAAQEQQEVERLKARIVKGLLDDPSPYRPLRELKLELDQDGAAQPGAASPAVPGPPPAPAPAPAPPDPGP